uniref:Uncharacterized protein n=1 Tax=Micrurus lemniscatus lemniscatus TaxID=129467 RepID=A0A2D4HMK3_MICLE
MTAIMLNSLPCPTPDRYFASLQNLFLSILLQYTGDSGKCYISLLEKNQHISRCLKRSTCYKKRISPERSRLFHLFLLYASQKPVIWDLSKNSSHNTLCQVVAVMGREKQSQNDLFYVVSRIQSNLTSLKPAFAPSLFILFTDFHKLFSCRKTKHQH